MSAARRELVELVNYLARETGGEYVDLRLSRAQLEELAETLADVGLLETMLSPYAVQGGAEWSPVYPAALMTPGGRKVLSVHNAAHGGPTRIARAIARLAQLGTAPAAEGGTHVPVRR